MRITVKVKPASRKPEITRHEDGTFTVRVCEPATSGKANEAVIRDLAEYFKIRRSKIHIVLGIKSKIKVVDIDEPN